MWLTDYGQIYDSPEALKKFEPHYRQVRYGLASKIEKASRQQRTHTQKHDGPTQALTDANRQAAQESFEGVARNGEGQGRKEEEGRLSDSMIHAYGAASLGEWTYGCHVAYLHASYLQSILHTGKAMALGCGPILAW